MSDIVLYWECKLLSNYMKPKTINIRDFQRNIKAITDQVVSGETFRVMRNAKLVFEVSPIVSVERKTKKRKKFTQEEYIAALNKMCFNLPKKENLSENIDKIVYK